MQFDVCVNDLGLHPRLHVCTRKRGKFTLILWQNCEVFRNKCGMVLRLVGSLQLIPVEVRWTNVQGRISYFCDFIVLKMLVCFKHISFKLGMMITDKTLLSWQLDTSFSDIDLHSRSVVFKTDGTSVIVYFFFSLSPPPPPPSLSLSFYFLFVTGYRSVNT